MVDQAWAQDARRSRRTTGEADEGCKGGWICDRDDVLQHHGETDFWLNGRGYYRCKRCRSAAVARRRRKVKESLSRRRVVHVAYVDSIATCAHCTSITSSHRRSATSSTTKEWPWPSISCGSRRKSACFCALIAMPRWRTERRPYQRARWVGTFRRSTLAIRGSSIGRVFGC